MPYQRPQALNVLRHPCPDAAAQTAARRVVHFFIHCVAVITLAVLWPVFAHAQNCKRLEPAGAGQDDAARINQCLITKGRAKLTAGTFLLYGPIVFPGGAWKPAM